MGFISVCVCALLTKLLASRIKTAGSVMSLLFQGFWRFVETLCVSQSESTAVQTNQYY